MIPRSQWKRHNDFLKKASRASRHHTLARMACAYHLDLNQEDLNQFILFPPVLELLSSYPQDKWQHAPRRRDPTLHILLSTITRGQDYTGQWKAFTIRSLCDLSIRGSEDLLASNLDSALSSHNLDLVIEQTIKHTVLQSFALELIVLGLTVLDLDQQTIAGSCKCWT